MILTIDSSSTRHPIDVRIGRTIAHILNEFFEKNENSMLMACDNTDGREGKRRILFTDGMTFIARTNS